MAEKGRESFYFLGSYSESETSIYLFTLLLMVITERVLRGSLFVGKSKLTDRHNDTGAL